MKLSAGKLILTARVCNFLKGAAVGAVAAMFTDYTGRLTPCCGCCVAAPLLRSKCHGGKGGGWRCCGSFEGEGLRGCLCRRLQEWEKLCRVTSKFYLYTLFDQNTARHLSLSFIFSLLSSFTEYYSAPIRDRAAPFPFAVSLPRRNADPH